MSERNYKVTDETFIETVKTSRNVCQVLKKLGLSFRGANYAVFKKRCALLGLSLDHFASDKSIRKSYDVEHVRTAVRETKSRMDCLKHLELNPTTNSNLNWIEGIIAENQIDNSHWIGQGHLKGCTHNWTPSKPLSEILREDSYLGATASLKRRLITEGLLEHKCSRCEILEWQGEELSLHLEHKNGDRSDNRIENLTLLCPNCHSLTLTYCRRKSALIPKAEKPAYNPTTKRKVNRCTDCQIVISVVATRCRSCQGKHRVIGAQSRT